MEWRTVPAVKGGRQSPGCLSVQVAHSVSGLGLIGASPLVFIECIDKIRARISGLHWDLD